MSIQESNVFTDKVVVNTTHLDEVDCVKKAFKVVRAMCGFGIPRLVKESITYRFLYEVMNGAIDLDCIADEILEKQKMDYEGIVTKLNSYKKQLNEIESGDYVNLYESFSSKKKLESWINTYELLCNEGYDDRCKRLAQTPKCSYISSYEDKSPKDIIIEVFNSVIADINLICSNSKYSNYIKTPAQKLKYVIILGGYNSSLSVASKFVSDRELVKSLNSDKDLLRGLSIISCITGRDYSSYSKSFTLYKIESDLNELLYDNDMGFMNNVKISSFKSKCVFDKSEDTEKYSSKVDFELIEDAGEITLDEAVKNVCSKLENFLVGDNVREDLVSNVARAGRSSTNHLSDEELEEGRKKLDNKFRG